MFEKFRRIVTEICTFLIFAASGRAIFVLRSVYVSIRKLKRKLKKKMYRVQIEVTTQQSGRIHLERESYRKAEECRLLSSAAPIVATVAKYFAKSSGRENGWAQTRR